MNTDMEHDILNLIYKSTLKFLAPLKPEETYETIVREAIKLVDADFGSLTIEEEGEFKEVFTTLPIKIKRRKNGLTYKAFKELKVILFHPKESKAFLKAHPEFADLPIESNLNIPLSYKKQSLGVLIVNSKKKRVFTPKELDILLLFGSLASLAIRKTQLYNETKKALEVRDMFISMAAHELRTPLTAINGYAQLLANKLSATAESSEARWAKQLTYECLRLNILVNELLEINRIKNGELNYEWKESDVKVILTRSINAFSFGHPNHEIVFDDKAKNKSSLIVGDFNKILQVFDNILENSAKFSRPGSKIKVLLSSTSNQVKIAVSDNGVGIKEVDLKNIYERFFIGSNHRAEGMGMGLFLVKNILQMHHGHIAIKSKEGKGTKVEVTLPLFKS